MTAMCGWLSHVSEPRTAKENARSGLLQKKRIAAVLAGTIDFHSIVLTRLSAFSGTNDMSDYMAVSASAPQNNFGLLANRQIFNLFSRPTQKKKQAPMFRMFKLSDPFDVYILEAVLAKTVSTQIRRTS